MSSREIFILAITWIVLSLFGFWAESAPTFTILGRKAPSNIINKGSREKSLARKVALRRR